MAVTANWYRQALLNMSLGKINFTGDTIKCMLCTSSYAQNLDTDAFKSAVTNEISGTGYTATGATLTSPTAVYTAANSWSPTWATGTAYVVGQIVRPTAGNGFVYVCTVAGTSHASVQPTWPTTLGAIVTDNTVTWACAGSGVLVLNGTVPTWTASTFTARKAVIYDATPATDATRPLLWVVDFGADQSPSAGNFQITFNAQGIAAIAIP